MTRDRAHSRRSKPKEPTANGQPFDPEARAFFHPDYPGETMGERGRRLGIIDEWIPELSLTYSSNHTLKFEGERALKIWDAWRAKIFGTKTKL